MGGLTALAPSDESGEETEVTEGEGEAEATEADEMSTVTVIVVDADGEAIQSANVEFVHDDAIIFDTRENKETDSEGIASFETETDSHVDITAEASGYEEADASLTVTEDEEVTLTFQEMPEESEEAEEAEQDAEPVDPEEGDDTPEEAEIEEAPEEEELTEDDYLYLIETTLQTEMDLNVADVYMEGDTTHVEYHSYAQNENELAGELGAVSGAYAGAVGDGHESEQLQITVLNATGDEAGTTTLDADTAEAYYNDEISEEELALEVLGNLEAND